MVGQLLPALLIVNPAAGPSWRRNRQRLDELRRVLEERGFDVEVRSTEKPGHATELAREAVSRGLAAVFALGGDGTQREAAAGLLGTPTPLGLLPAGTANVLAPCCGLPRSPLRAAGCYGVEAELPRARDLDVGVLEDRSGARPFLMMASRGLDARTLRSLQPALKRRLGKAGVALAGLGEWARAAEPEFDYVADGEPARASFVAVQNIAGYAGLGALAPAADPFDGRLDLVAFAGSGRAATLGFAAALLVGRHPRDRRVRLCQVGEVTFPGAGRALLQLDGDAVEAELPATVRLHAAKLRILVPAIESTTRSARSRAHDPRAAAKADHAPVHAR